MNIRETLRARRAELTAVRVEDVLPQTVWMHQPTVAEMDSIRSASMRFDKSDEAMLDVERFNNLLIAACLYGSPDPEAERLYSPGDVDALREELLPGERAELLEWINAMLGYRNSKSGLLPTLRAGASSGSGACTAAEDGTPAS